MDCERLTDERLQADKMDVLYGEADRETRARLDAHLASCEACRDEMGALSATRRDLASWRRPRAWMPRAARARAVVVIPRWLAAAAVLVLGIGVGVSASAYVSLRRALAEQSARAAALEASQQRTARALETALAQPAARTQPSALLTLLDSRLEQRIRASEERQQQRMEARFADWGARTNAQRRVDLARVAEGLTYLDGRHAQQLQRTNELMGYVLAAQER